MRRSQDVAQRTRWPSYGLALLLLVVWPGIAWANPFTAPIWELYGPYWWLIVTTMIVAVEWPIFARLTRWHWGWSLAAVVLANVLSACTAYALPQLDVVGMVALTVPVEGAVIALIAWLLSTSGLRWPQSLWFAVFVMNTVSFPIAPVMSGIFRRHLEVADATGTCERNLQQIGEALKAYARDNDGALPPVQSAAELRDFPALSKEFGDPALLHCPQFDRWALRDPHPTELNYKLYAPLPKWLPKRAHGVNKDARPYIILADDAPRHGVGGRKTRNCLLNDGNVMQIGARNMRWYTGPSPEQRTAPKEAAHGDGADGL